MYSLPFLGLAKSCSVYCDPQNMANLKPGPTTFPNREVMDHFS